MKAQQLYFDTLGHQSDALSRFLWGSDWLECGYILVIIVQGVVS